MAPGWWGPLFLAQHWHLQARQHPSTQRPRVCPPTPPAVHHPFPALHYDYSYGRMWVWVRERSRGLHTGLFPSCSESCSLHPSRHWSSLWALSPSVSRRYHRDGREVSPGPAWCCCSSPRGTGAVIWVPCTILAGATWLAGPLESGRHPHAIPLAGMSFAARGGRWTCWGVLGWRHTCPSCVFWAGGFTAPPPLRLPSLVTVYRTCVSYVDLAP